MIINEIQVGQYEPYNNMMMFRVYDSKRGFIPIFQVNGFGENQTLDMNNKIIIPYIEFFKNTNGDVLNELTRFKYYEIHNLPQLVYSEGETMQNGTIAIGGEIKRNQWNAANDWFLLLARTPQTQNEQSYFLENFTGIIDAIEYTLAGLPLETPNGYILQNPL